MKLEARGVWWYNIAIGRTQDEYGQNGVVNPADIAVLMVWLERYRRENRGGE